MLSINLKPSGQLLSELGHRAKSARLRLNLSRQTLAERTGVPASTIKRFETTGLIGTAAMADILLALGRLDELAHLFAAQAVPTIAELDLNLGQRQRGRQ
jgi:transcriptional regulator with XRE-family HTH domain